MRFIIGYKNTKQILLTQNVTLPLEYFCSTLPIISQSDAIKQVSWTADHCTAKIHCALIQWFQWIAELYHNLNVDLQTGKCYDTIWSSVDIFDVYSKMKL
jgi:hypothetical protein